MATMQCFILSRHKILFKRFIVIAHFRKKKVRVLDFKKCLSSIEKGIISRVKGIIIFSNYVRKEKYVIFRYDK